MQIIVAADKEHVLSQKRASASWGVEVPVGYSVGLYTLNPVDPLA